MMVDVSRKRDFYNSMSQK